MSFAKRSLGLLTLSASALLVSETRNATRARVPDHSSAPDAGETTKSTGSWARDSFSGNKVGVILLVLIGMTAGQAVVWYQGQFQANFFMTTYLKLTFTQSYTVMLWAVALGTPVYIA